jgi:ABC-2 type transport system permease protein
MLAVLKRELKAYFSSTIGFIFVGFFVLLAGLFFSTTNLLPANPDYTQVLASITFVFLIVVPLLTMRLLPEEIRQRTDQLLITSSLSITGIVTGKYLAAVSVFLLSILITIVFPVMLSFFAVGGLAWREIISCYIGFFMLGSSFIAVGLFFSSFTESQIIAAALTFAALLPMYLIDWFGKSIPTDAISGLVFIGIIGAGLVALVFISTRSASATAATGLVVAAGLAALFFLKPGVFQGLIGKVLDWFSLLKRMDDFAMGILNLSAVVYYLLFSCVFIFLTVRMIERKRWM